MGESFEDHQKAEGLGEAKLTAHMVVIWSQSAILFNPNWHWFLTEQGVFNALRQTLGLMLPRGC